MRSMTGAAPSASRALLPIPPGGPDVEEPQPASRPRQSLASQIESAMARLTVLRGSDQAGPVLGAALDQAVRALDALRPEAARARGEARDELMRRVCRRSKPTWPIGADQRTRRRRIAPALEQEADARARAVSRADAG